MPTRTDNQRQKYTEKTHLLLRILVVIGRFGPHLTIVMIFVTQNNFKNGPRISDRLLGFHLVGITTEPALDTVTELTARAEAATRKQTIQQ